MSEADRSLLEFLDSSQLTCLNESQDHPLRAIVSKENGGPATFLQSDVDEQLLLNITFNQTVRVRTLSIRCTDIARAPRKIKLLINQPSLAFDDIETADIAQEIDLSQEQVSKAEQISLRYVRFQAVNSLHIFVESNHGDEEETRIDEVNLFGLPVLGVRDLSALRTQEE